MFRRRTKPTKLNHIGELEDLVGTGRPVLLDFMQVGCASCKVMDGIMNELADEYGESAHVVKVDVARVPGAAQAFNVRSTPTFVLLSNAPKMQSAKAARKAKQRQKPAPGRTTSKLNPRWRSTGLVKKDQLARILESNGAYRAD